MLPITEVIGFDKRIFDRNCVIIIIIIDFVVFFGDFGVSYFKHQCFEIFDEDQATYQV